MGVGPGGCPVPRCVGCPALVGTETHRPLSERLLYITLALPAPEGLKESLTFLLLLQQATPSRKRSLGVSDEEEAEEEAEKRNLEGDLDGTELSFLVSEKKSYSNFQKCP